MLAFALMCFSSPGYFESAELKEYSIFEMISMLGTERAENYEFSAQSVCSRGFGSWLMMFLCIIVSFPFVKLLCDERCCGEKRCVISRTGIFRYCLAKFTSAVISAALICAAGYLIFTGFANLIFPQISEFPALQQEMLANDAPYWSYLLSAVLTGICSAILPFLICSVTTNQYFCTCIPFLLQYMYSIASSKLAASDNYNPEDLKSIIVQIASPYSLEMLIHKSNTGYYALAFHLIFAAAALWAFLLSQRRCTDVGQ